MMSIADRVEQARTYVLDIFELDANTVDVVVADWTSDGRDYLQVRIIIQNAIQLRVEVTPAGRPELLLPG